MKISKNIELAKKDYPEMYHVVRSNEVHSFETLTEALKDLKINSIGVEFDENYSKHANFNLDNTTSIITPFPTISNAKD